MNSPSSDQVSGLLRSLGSNGVIFLVGAGGCGMSGLGHLLLDLGHRVAGSDLVLNEEVHQLKARGAQIRIGHSAADFIDAKPSLVVYSSAIRRDNPELQSAEQLQIPIVRRAVLLAALLHRQRGICVAGMHGKTTTTALLAYALTKLNARPSYAVGALVPQLVPHARFSVGPSHSSAGASPFFVIEADESDGTLRQFHPEHAILLNVDAEHLDYYIDLEAVCREFGDFAAQVRSRIVFCADDSRLAELLARRPDTISYGFHSLAQYRIVVRPPSQPGAWPMAHGSASAVCRQSFELWRDGQKLGDFSIRLIGQKNVSNAAAVIAFLHQLGFAPEAIAAAIADFSGAARRQQELFRDERFRVFDDYGHHPCEIEATLKAFKDLAPRRLLVAFEPHRFTRTQALMHEFATCFQDADRLWVTDIYAASESEIPGVTSARLVEAIRAVRREIADDARSHPGPLPEESERDGKVRSGASASPRSSDSVSRVPPQHHDGSTADDVSSSPGGEGRGEGGPTGNRREEAQTTQPAIANRQSEINQSLLTSDPAVEYIPALSALRRAVRAAMLPGDWVLFLGAGDVTKAAHELAAELRAEAVSSNEQTLAALTACLSTPSVVRRDEPLAKRTTMRVGGQADYYVEPASEEDLSRALKFCAERKLKFTMLGRGSNLLIKDGGIRGMVICLCHPNFSWLEIVGDKLHCGAGVKLKAVSVEARRAGLAGLEFLEGIPGSLGGSMRMNAGAMGSWLFDMVESIRFMDYSGRVHERQASEVNVEYRGCPLFKTHIALSAVLKGTPATKETVAARMEQFSAKRWESQPKESSAGCIFKNPKTIPAGKLIDELGLKGTRVGGAMVSDVHGNFIVNDGSATASDVLGLIDVVKQRVKSARGIELETEVEILGEG